MFTPKKRETGMVLAEPQQMAQVLSLVTDKLGKKLARLTAENAKYWAGGASNREFNKG